MPVRPYLNDADVQRIVDSPSGAQRLFASDVFGNVTRYTDPLGGLRQLYAPPIGRRTRRLPRHFERSESQVRVSTT